MKRLWAVVLTAGVAVGCRSSQQPTNPFLRTTVPPPATGEAVVVPGEPYTPGAVAPPADPAAIPVVPPMTAPPPAGAPMPLAPPPNNNRYAPPGGSYLYNQSSLERSKSVVPDNGQSTLEGTALARHEAAAESNVESLDDLQIETRSNAVQQAVAMRSDEAPPKESPFVEDAKSGVTTAAFVEPLGEKTPIRTAERIKTTISPKSSIRLVDSQAAVATTPRQTVPQPASSQSVAVMRITATGSDKQDSSASQVVLKTDASPKSAPATTASSTWTASTRPRAKQ